ncbi:MAG: MiaB/RimO family radical SAM methylthiotransferase [Candidatus Omnitrophica bacterium]|nr:MiaB/RimO family radical SAM methylthiotransferase [Candidatus Omnitrophota bacterium]
MKKPKIGVLSLGCPRNLVDTEMILSRLYSKGYSITDIDKADIAILNTCAFIKEAKEESIEAILDFISLKKESKIKKLIVYGCLVERYKEKLITLLKDVDAFVGRISLNHQPKRIVLTPSHYAYVKINEGCINNCSFCIIPKIKLPLVSRTPESIIEEIRFLEKKGVKEINLVGQDTTLYGKDLFDSTSLVFLLKKILKETKSIPWIRLLYLYPNRITDELLQIIRKEERICKYIDLPLQHVNNRILKLMNRNITKDKITELIDKIRNTIPTVFIRTTFLVGFPTETDAEFEELLNFIKEFKFERLGTFIYSREEGTVAYNFKPQIHFRKKQTRFNIIMETQKAISEEINRSLLGRTLDVIIDEESDSFYLARTQYDAPEVDGLVFVKKKYPLEKGKLLKVKITDTLEYDLVGDPL